MPNTHRHPLRALALTTCLCYVSTFGVPTLLFAQDVTPTPVAKKKALSEDKKRADEAKSNEENDEIETTGYPDIFIGPGDLLFISVYGENGRSGISNGLGDNQLNTDYQVDSKGNITFPFIGTVHLGGMSPTQASEKIANSLNKPRKVTVLIKESNTYWVSILGNVLKPGKYQIHGKPTLLSALAEAGGPLPNSDLGGTILIHKGQKKQLDLNHYFHGEGTIDNEPYLYPGDVVSVAKSGWPTLGEIAIVTSILASAAVITVELSNLRK